ncbi:hypothetical protein V6N12_046049 [Hibiscus sabdariffa]|uniref:Uncharacterized protein n=1 Tax=Hibiscus sabdariffa TaxID=183260 RepID=A0ABR2G4J7_9ROSI
MEGMPLMVCTLDNVTPCRLALVLSRHPILHEWVANFSIGNHCSRSQPMDRHPILQQWIANNFKDGFTAPDHWKLLWPDCTILPGLLVVKLEKNKKTCKERYMSALLTGKTF